MTRNIVSFDFDGVLHSSMEENSLNPISHTEWNLTPCYKMHELLKKEYNDGNDIIIVSARSETYENGIDIVKRAMWRFIKHYDLPVSELYLTNNKSKRNILVQLNVIRHYDDNIYLKNALKKTDVEFIFVKDDEIIFRC